MPITWDNFYSIGIHEIDGQHKAFINMLNEVNGNYLNSKQDLKSNEAQMKIYSSILNLRKYALDHFSDEEKFMIKYRYPKFFDHKKNHDAFIKKIFELEEELFSSGDLSPVNLIEFMSSWLDGHIRRMDKDFGNYLRLIVGKTP